MALAFKFASIIAFIVKERADRSKHQQIVSGMNIKAYWTANLAYDYALYLVISVVAIGIAIALDIQFITKGKALTVTWILFIFYGLSYISLTYVMSFCFKDYGNAQASYYFITLIIGGLLPILVFLMRVLADSSNPVGRGLAWGFRLYPAYCFGEGIMNIGSVNLYGIK
jgi:ATP-binding cassette, subfamily A (ABC1), member 3